MDDCIFCKIIKGDSPAFKIYEDEFTLAFLDISKDAYGHTLVIPKTHSTDIFDTDTEVLKRVAETIKKVSNHYKSLGFDGVNIINASGKSAEQSVFHLHFHIIPRKTGDELHIWPNLEKQEIDLTQVHEHLKIK